MKLQWKVEAADIRRVQKLIRENRRDPFVGKRKERNLRRDKAPISRSEFWIALVSCLLTTQQRSGPNSAVNRFILTKPSPLSLRRCRSAKRIAPLVKRILTDFGGIRRTSSIASELERNLLALESGLWTEAMEWTERLRPRHNAKVEREAADFFDDHLVGFGPKQSRNLLQSLGLTMYEIPIDSRILKWLNEFGFPIKLTAAALSDRAYFHMVLDGLHELCNKSRVHPCVLDAVIFSSADKGAWTEENVTW